MLKKSLLLLLFISVVISAQKNYYTQILKKSQFVELQGEPLNDKFANLKSVKVVWDFPNKKLYFFNSKKFKYHHNFCEDILGFNDGLGSFNDQSYNPTNNRKYLLANLNFIEKSDDWVLELAASDEMNAEMVNLFFNEVKKNVYFKDKLKFYLNTPRLMKLKELGKIKIASVYSDFIFKNITEQSIEFGKTVGIFRKYDLQKKEKFNPKSNEIVLINTTPEIIPDVKGIIVTEFQTPLSHLVLLAKNRNIPVYVLTDAWNNEKINSLVGKKVEFSVTNYDYILKPTTLPISATKAREKIVLKKDLSVKNLVNLNEKAPLNGQNFIGSKALNLAYLKELSKELKTFKTPEYAYAIPFYFYEEHIKENNLQPKIDELLSTPKDSLDLIKSRLKDIRKSFKNSKVNPKLIEEITQTLGKQNDFKNFKFRSSTNAEDLEGFNGAGLYDSKSAILGDSNKTVEKAILEVWSSFWNERAFLERELFNIDHKSCAMGVLIHRSFPDELANGVLISKNLYRSEYEGITVNVQKGETSVVQPEKGVTCDEFYVHNFNYMDNKLSIDYRSTSSLNDKKPILTELEIKNLFSIARNLERKLNSIWKSKKIAKKFHPIDIEFKIVGEKRELYIKQIRAFMD